MNDMYFDERVKHNRIGNLGFELVNTQRKLVYQEYEIEKLRIKAAMYRAFSFTTLIWRKDCVIKTRKMMTH